IIGSRPFRIASTVALIGVGVSQIPLGDVLDRLDSASLPLVTLGAALLLLGQIVSGQRWRELSLQLGLDETPRWFIAIYLRGCFYNSVLPTGIGGDAVRVGAVRPLGTWKTATRSVVTDRVTGLVALALAAGALLPVAGLGLPPEITWPVAIVSYAGLGATVVVAAQRGLLSWLGWTLVFEVVWFTGVWALARSLSIPLGWATPAVVLVVGIAMALPISFGGHGAREAGFLLALAPLGVAADAAVALGVLFGAALAAVGLVGAFVRVRPARVYPMPDPQSLDAAPSRVGVSVGVQS
ncbi:MAG: flippase-like domain-containing protein, partial [Solirubrobacteraceae bacterium]|nr:flippase-like domain-containing protein [Solirubrobacteraceae bacterium]